MTDSHFPSRYALAYRVAIFACASTALCVSKSHAEAVVRHAWTVAQGQATILASYYEIQESNCMALRAPPVTLKARPSLGSLSLNRTFMLAANPPKCPHIRVPVTQVIYHSRKATGTSQAAWDVHFQSRSLGTQQVKGTITVRPGPP